MCSGGITDFPQARRTLMEHYDITHRFGFVRGASTASEREAPATHPSGGCKECNELAALGGRIQRHAGIEPVVPEHLVHRAKSVFEPQAGKPILLPRLDVRLHWTRGAGALAEASVRASPFDAAELICRAGDYTIELRIEREPEETELAVIGQASRSADRSLPLKDAAVLLMARARLLTRATTSPFGEFCLVSRIRPSLRLCLQLNDIGKQIEIPLTTKMLSS
jgi:hypothetical protein